MQSIDYIEKLAKQKDWSDYRIAKELEIGRSAISQHRRGEVLAFSDETALKIAELLEIDAAVVIADMHLARRPSKKLEKFWKKVAAGAVCIVLMAIGTIKDTTDYARASTGEPGFTRYTLCAMKERVLTLLRSIRGSFGPLLAV